MATKSEKVSNLGESTLASGYTAGQTTLSVASAASFPTDGIFRVRLANPSKTTWRVDSVSGATFTGAAEEDDGDALSGVAVVQVGTRGAAERLLQSPIDGEGYAPSGVDGGDANGMIYKFIPYSATGMTWVNQGGATETITSRIAHLVAPPNPGQSLRQRVKTPALSTPYKLTVVMEPVMISLANAHDVGILFRESATGKIAAIRMSNNQFKVTTGTDAWAADQAATEGYAGNMGRRVWLRLINDGTNLSWQFSFVGPFHFTNVITRVKTADFTTAPDQIGYVVNEQANLQAAQVSILSWAEEAA